MTDVMIMLSVLGVSFLVGYRLILRVPSLLHTPLMSMTNAISGVTLLGAMLVFAVEPHLLEGVLGSVAIFAATFNVVGGFAVTDRMLSLFRKKASG